MTKKQKIWLWIFIAMFIIPEVLWSPIANLYYELLQSGKSGGTHSIRSTFLQNSDNVKILKFVILLQFIGLLFSVILIIKNVRNLSIVLKYSLIAICVTLLLVALFALYFTWVFNVEIF